ncbi:hypothetical protein [Desertimonas flava]|jgi:hypothetical protein|uniref:hypothetical protein n=1 Tax=Desertimonas flava TaxID=2064846 RepID=UPI000E354977|nr:hypothetical protein [Desertimonas flava]
MRLRHLIALPIAVASIGLVAGCSEDDRENLLDDGVELAVRNFAALQGAEQFNHAGHEIDDDGLKCTATVSEGGREAVDVECTGTTVDGGEAVLSGRTSELPGASITELEGDFTATVDGETVFTTQELGG